MSVEQLPLWKGALRKMIEGGMTFGSEWTAQFFEENLKEPCASKRYEFALIHIRREIKRLKLGYVLHKRGNVYRIQVAEKSRAVGKRYEAKTVRDARDAFDVQAGTLNNPAANLQQKAKEELTKGAERAAFRLALVKKPRTIMKIVQRHKPKLAVNG